MAVQPWVTGPAHVFVKTQSPTYFGTGKQGVRIEKRPAYVPLMNDIAGPTVPLDMCQVGADYIVSGTFTRWSEDVHSHMTRFARPGDQEGEEDELDRGTLMLHEDQAFELWVLYPRAQNLAQYADLRRGYHFLAAMLISPLSLEPGTKPYEVTFTWQCLPKLNDNGEGFKAYNNDMSGLTIS